MGESTFAAIAALVFASTLVSCARGNGESEPATKSSASSTAGVTTAPDNPASATANPAPQTVALARVRGSEEGDGALFQGTLSVENGCAYLTGGDTRMLLVAANDGIVATQNGVRDGSISFAWGDSIEVGGSSTSTTTLAPLWTQKPPSACTAERSWLAVSLRRPE